MQSPCCASLSGIPLILTHTDSPAYVSSSGEFESFKPRLFCTSKIGL